MAIDTGRMQQTGARNHQETVYHLNIVFLTIYVFLNMETNASEDHDSNNSKSTTNTGVQFSSGCLAVLKSSFE